MTAIAKEPARVHSFLAIALSCSNLPEIVTSETIEAILNKDQGLTLIQIKQLAQRFKTKPQLFID